jgi:dihydroxyacetone kinase-like protein
MSGFTTADLRTGAARIAAAVAVAADDLNAADGRLGDGDLGITVSRGWAEIAATATMLPDDVGLAFLDCAKAFQRVSSSSFGTLTATAFIAAARACKGRTEVPWPQVPMLLAAARDAMMVRGKGALGDKTVLDMLDAIVTATTGLDAPDALLAAARSAATATLDAFRDRENRLGRARMFGERSRGLDDPGMLALARMIAGLAAKA